MKVIFLDIDGVFITHRSLEKFHGAQTFGPWNVKVFNRIIERTGAKIVISSVWRYDGMEKLIPKLRAQGLSGAIIGRTPMPKESKDKRIWEGKARGYEIQEWLDNWAKEWHKPEDKVESFVIIDDDSDMHHLRHRLVQTRFATGLCPRHMEPIIKLLNTPLKENADGRG